MGIALHERRSRGAIKTAKMIVVATGLAKHSRYRKFNFGFSASPETFKAADC